jgi:hypothetical protein
MAEKKRNRSKTPRTKKPNVPTAYLLKRGDKFYMVPANVVDTLTIEEAFRLALIAHAEQRRQLLEDALKGDHYINNIKVVDGLEASLKKLDEMFPALRDQVSRIHGGYNYRMGRS